MELPVDKFHLYGASAARQEAFSRQAMYLDTQAAIGMLFSKNKKDGYFKELLKLSE